MTIQTIPVFYYIDPISASNNLFDFLEPSGLNIELNATIASGAYSLTSLMSAVQDSLNALGDLTYSLSLNRDTRLVTITCSAIFDMLITSGSSADKIFSTLGFNGADLTGATSYTGDTAIGSTYSPQFRPQEFKSFNDNKENIAASVNESADGIVEVLTFGVVSRMTMNLKYITDRLRGKDSRIANNQNALSELRTFLDFLITKQDLEFMIDKSDTSTFDTVFLDRTATSRAGVGYEIRELIGEGLNDYYETGRLVFRKK